MEEPLTECRMSDRGSGALCATEVPLKLKHEAELWERLQRDIEWLKRERAKEAAAAKDAVANAMAAAEELHKVGGA